MNKVLVSFLMMMASVPVFATDLIGQNNLPTNTTVLVNREVLGSGTPGLTGFEDNVYAFGDGTYFAPQYLPGTPTAGTIYPRVVDVRCTEVDEVVKCEGYHWTPDMGRAEYLLVHPIIVKAPKPVIKEVPVIVYKEVPVKKKKE
jgi:hypothetical protein